MLLALALFWLVLLWGYTTPRFIRKRRRSSLWFGWLAGCMFFVPKLMILSIIGLVLLDIILLAKVFGNFGGR